MSLFNNSIPAKIITDDIKTAVESINTKIPAGLTLSGDSLKVYVSNQIDLTTITSYLLDIKNRK